MECIEDKTALTYPWLECCQDDQNSPPDKHDERCSTPSAWSDASPLASSPSTPNLLQPTRERLLTYFIGQDIKLTNLAASQETDGENRTYFLQRIPPTSPISSGKSKTVVEYEYDDYVDALISWTTIIVEAIWSDVDGTLGRRTRRHLDLRTYIYETLRQACASCSTLKVALYYLLLIKPQIPALDFDFEYPINLIELRHLRRGRTMFLIALIVASKYLQDKNYSLRVWSQKSGLSVGEIRSAEVTFILALDWRLHITNDVFQKWTDTVLDLVSPETAVGDPEVQGHLKWIIRELKPDLSNAEDFKN